MMLSLIHECHRKTPFIHDTKIKYVNTADEYYNPYMVLKASYISFTFYNITIGFPQKDLTFHSWFHSWFDY